MSKGYITKLWEEFEREQRELLGELELTKFFSQNLRRKPIKKYMRQFKLITKVYQEKTDEELLEIMQTFYFELEEQ